MERFKLSKKRQKENDSFQCPICNNTYNGDNDFINCHITFCGQDKEKKAKESNTNTNKNNNDNNNSNNDNNNNNNNNNSNSNSNSNNNNDNNNNDNENNNSNNNNNTESYACPICNENFIDINNHVNQCLSNQEKKKQRKSKDNHKNNIDQTEIQFALIPGLFLIYDFITEEEEHSLLDMIEKDKQKWRQSTFNGDYFVKAWGYITKHGSGDGNTGFVRKNIVENNEPDLPDYFQFLINRMMMVIKYNNHLPIELKKELSDFVITECNCNCYIKKLKHQVDFHFDDRGLSGKCLLNLSLFSNGIMRYRRHPVKSGNNEEDTKIELPRRTLQIVSGTARFGYKHAIFSNDILEDKRISLTFRSPLFIENDKNDKKITNYFNNNNNNNNNNNK